MFCLFGFGNIANAQWEWQNPLPQGNTLNSVYFTDANTGFAVGDYGTILKYDGTNWIFQEIGLADDIKSISFYDSNNGLAVGANGTILYYNGLKWIKDVSPTTKKLNSVCILNSNEAWAVGESGTILKWNGNSWGVETTSVTSDEIISVFFIDATHGWALTKTQILFYNGSSWSIQSTATYSTFVGFSLIGLASGWVVTQNGSIYKFNGTEWIYDFSLSENVYSIHFLDANHGWIGAYSKIYEFNGSSWTSQSLNSTFFEIYFQSGNNGWALGASGSIYKYDGTNWQQYSKEISKQNINSIYMLDSINGWAVGDKYTILKHDLNGWSVDTTNPNVVVNFNSVFFTDSSHGWIVGTHNKILKYENGKWIKQTSGAASNSVFNSVYFTDSIHGWAVGNYGLIYKFDGNTWINQSFQNLSTCIESVFMLDSMSGWAVGAKKTIIKYNGTSWEIVEPTGSSYLESVFFTDANNGWAVGYDTLTYKSRILKYIQGTWSSYNTSSIFTNQQYQFLYDIYMNSNNCGWITGINGILLKYDGTNWIQQRKRTYYGLNSVFFTDSLHGWIAGNNGEIMKTSNGGLSIPLAPTNLTLSSQKNILSKMLLSWTDNSNNEDGFRIYRSTDGVNFYEIGTTAANINSYIDSTGAASTLYYYQVTAYNSAGSSTFSNTISGTTTNGINDITQNNAVSIYPNPNNGKFIIEPKNNNRLTNIEVYNSLGEKVLQQNANEIELSASPKGIYIVKISDGVNTYNRRIVLQ